MVVAGRKGAEHDGRLQAELIAELPSPMEVGGGSAVFLDGRALLDGVSPAELVLVAAEREVPLMGWGAPPPRRIDGEDYWWTVLPLEPVTGPETVPLRLRARGRPGGDPIEVGLGELTLAPSVENPAGCSELESAVASAPTSTEPLVAICMATFEPDLELLARQANSIRRQTHRRWVCLISDDGSGRRSLEGIRELIAEDRRFVLSAAPRNRGFYENFERALTMVPAEADLVALSDQDDVWRPDKLERLIDGLDPDSALVYSDMRIVDRHGTVLSDTYWQYRRNNHTRFPSLFVANTVTGAATLVRSELLSDILPFPPRHARAYHDHWIAQVAMALGPISYVDEPLYDYVQHGEAAIGHLEANGEGRFSGSLAQRGQITLARFRRRRYRLGWRQPYFNVYCRLTVAATALLVRLGPRLQGDRTAFLQSIVEPRMARRWALRRVLRDGLRNTETLGRERVILAGLAWSETRRRSRRHVARSRSRGRGTG